MKAVEALADTIADAGVRHVFTVMGDANLDLLDALARRGVVLVHARHEQGAVAMADGYARVTGGLGVCSVTSGAGLTQTATSLATARAYGSPVLLVAGDRPAAERAAGGFDQEAFGRLAAGAAHTLLSAHDIAGTIARVAERLCDGPVVLNAPTDVQRDEAGSGSLPRLDAGARAERRAPADAEIERAASALGAAVRPMVLAGRGAVDAAGDEALARLADRLGAPIATTLLAHGLCAGHPRQIGISGWLGDGRASRALRESDCVYAAGTSLSSWTVPGGRLEAAVVRVDDDPGRLDGAAVAVLGDVRLATERVLDRLGPGGPGAADVPPRPRPDPAELRDGEGTVDPRRALLALDAALPRDRRLVVDGGHFAIFASQLLTVHDPGQFVFTSDFGAIGQGLATAIGAAFAAPAPRTTLVVGDGGLLMAVAELETAARYGVPLTLFVMNDDGYGQERHSLRAKGLPPEHAVLPTPDLAAMARAAGAGALRIDSPAGLDGLAAALAEATGPILVEVRINGDVVNPASAEIAAALRGER